MQQIASTLYARYSVSPLFRIILFICAFSRSFHPALLWAKLPCNYLFHKLFISQEPSCTARSWPSTLVSTLNSTIKSTRIFGEQYNNIPSWLWWWCCRWRRSQSSRKVHQLHSRIPEPFIAPLLIIGLLWPLLGALAILNCNYIYFFIFPL